MRRHRAHRPIEAKATISAAGMEAGMPILSSSKIFMTETVADTSIHWNTYIVFRLTLLKLINLPGCVFSSLPKIKKTREASIKMRERVNIV